MNMPKIWKHQKEFNRKLVDMEEVLNQAVATGDFTEFRKWNNFYTLALFREVGEVLDTVDWKIHRKENKPVIKSNTLEELVDCLKYWMCLCQLHGFTPEDVEYGYYQKSSVVEQRHKQEIRESVLESGQPVAGIDIDGILADYPRSFVEFINEFKGTNYRVEDVKDYNIYASLGIPAEEGLHLKDQYRQTGQKRFIPVIPGAKEFLDSLREAGYKVVLLTARPYQKYNRIFSDTMEWLARNELHYDTIIFDKDKEERLVKDFGAENIAFFVDDVSGNANAIAKLGIPCYLVSRPYNLESILSGGVTRVANLQEVLDHVTG